MKAKKFFLVTIMAIFSFLSFGQITNLYLTKDSSVIINKLYVGTLIGTNFSIDSLHAFGFTSVRAGVLATYQPTKWLAFKSGGVYQVQTGQSPLSKYQFEVKLSPFKKMEIEFGSFTTLPTEQRPDPASGNGHFETWSEASIPGGSLNAKIKYQFVKNFQAGTGIALRNGLPEYSGMINLFDKIKVSGWYTEHNKKFGTAVTLTAGRFYSCLVWNQDQTIADILCIKISKKIDLKIYSDMGYSFQAKKLVRGEWGLLKSFESKWIKGLFGLGYQHESRSICGYLFVHN